MCELIAAIDNRKNKEPVNPIIVDLYEDQYKRGTEGFGVIALDKNKKVEIMRATEPAKFMYDLHNKLSSMVFAHHRTPTSTKNKIAQTHPILVDNNILENKYYVMHNGMIRNCDELKEEHNKMGFDYTTEVDPLDRGNYYQKDKFNDSEALAIDMVLYLEKMQNTVKFEGSAAFIILKVDKKTNKALEFIYGRHSNPLNIENKEGMITVASEGPGDSIPENVIFTMKLNDKLETTEEELKFPIKEEKKTLSPYSERSGNGFGIQPKEDKTRVVTVVTMTEEDMKEVENYQPDYPMTAKTWDNEMEFLQGEIHTLVEDFIDELEDEKLVYTVDIEDYLGKIKKMLKETKGKAVSYYRNFEESMTEEGEDVATGYNHKHYNIEKEVDDYNDEWMRHIKGDPRQGELPSIT